MIMIIMTMIMTRMKTVPVSTIGEVENLQEVKRKHLQCCNNPSSVAMVVAMMMMGPC